MVVGTQKIHDNTVNTAKIAADTVLPVDFDQTAAYNFSATGSSFAGVFGTARVQCFQVSDLGATSTARGYPKGNFAATPIIIADLRANKTSTGSLYVTANSASSYTIYCREAPASTSAYVVAVNMT